MFASNNGARRMSWEKKGTFRWDRDDKRGTISASRHSGQIMYSAWVPAPEQRTVHPVGWRCVAIVTTPGEAREAIGKFN